MDVVGPGHGLKTTWQILLFVFRGNEDRNHFRTVIGDLGSPGSKAYVKRKAGIKSISLETPS